MDQNWTMTTVLKIIKNRRWKNGYLNHLVSAALETGQVPWHFTDLSAKEVAKDYLNLCE